MEHVFEHIDFTEANTGILKDRAKQFIDISYFDGVTLMGTNLVTPLTFGLIYATLLDGTVDSSAHFLPPLSTYPYVKPYSEGDTIPIFFLHAEYNYLDTNAVNDNLFTIQNNQLIDVPNRQNSPYLSSELFLSSTWIQDTIIGDTITFMIPSGGIVSNSTANIDEAKIDFDDGNGFQIVQEGDVIQVSYDKDKTYNIISVFTLSNGNILTSHSNINVKMPLPIIASGSGGEPYDDDFIFNIPITGAATVTGLSSCADTFLRKPIIIIEGFNVPDDNALIDQFGGSFEEIFNSISRGLAFGDTPTSNRIRNDLAAANYDLVYIDFDDGTDWMQTNAEIVKEVIREVNARKIIAGSEEENIVIGISMGGLLGKLALREMEIAEEDHETRLFFSFDSPLRGANMPLGAQYALEHIANIRIGGIKLRDFRSNEGRLIRDAEATLERPAPKQMLVYHKDGDQYPATHYNSRALYGHLEAMGGLEQCEHVAISNGSQIGNDQGYGANASLVRILGTGLNLALASSVDNSFLNYILGFYLAPLSPAPLSLFNIEIKAVPGIDDGERLIYKGGVYALVFGIPVAFTFKKATVEGTYAIDSAPGGDITLDLDPNTFNSLPINIKERRFCFIPTVSSLELGPFHGAGLASVSFDPYEDVSDNNVVLNSGLTSINSFIAINQSYSDPYDNNDPHVSFTYDNSGVLLTKLLEETNSFSLLSDRTYNYGENVDYEFDYTVSPLPTFVIPRTSHIIDNNMTITNTGKLWVNRNDLIAYTDVAINPTNSPNKHFDLYIKGDWCDGSNTNVNINSGGEFQVGEWENVHNSADVHIQSNAIVFVQNGGQLEVDQHSKITIENGGQLVVNSGGTLRLTKGGKVNIEEGGQLIILPGANIDLWWDDFEYHGNIIEGSSIHVKDGGELIIHGGFNFSGSGFFQFDGGNILTLLAPFELTGTGKGNRFVRLNDKATLDV